MKLDVLIIRIAFVALLALFGYLLNPFERTQRFGLSEIDSQGVRHALSAFLGLVIGLRLDP